MSKINFLKNLDVRNKRALVRVDFDLPLDKKGKVSDTFRLKESLPTIQYLIRQKAKVILISHLGRPNGKKIEKLSLKPIAKILSKFLKKKVLFASDPGKMKSGDVLLLENIRFFKEEEENSLEFAKKLVNSGDIFINEAFAVSHRECASIVGIPKFLPSAAGFSLEKEIKELNKILKSPKKPLVAIIGGAKMETKIKVINKFLKIADKVLIGGALANTIFASKGVSMGDSVIDVDVFGEVKKIDPENLKLFLPIDLGIWNKGRVYYKEVSNLFEKEKALDIGPKTINLFCEIIKNTKTVVWNGPLGLTEQKPFDKASKEIVNCIAGSKAYSMVGGGDTIAFVREIKKEKVFDWISTGGGAMLDYLANGTLPGIEALKE